MEPSSIAHYRIISKLGQGGMGEVWRATDTKLGRDVAIKILPDAFAGDPDRMARFTREAQVLASLNHRNIAAIYGVEERALVMELVDGPTLEDRVGQGPLPMEEAVNIAGQMAEALEYAHEKGIIHRDLKPANVKITPEGTVKVLDFGLAKAADPAPSGNASISPTLTLAATSMGVIMGTAAYMSPEQAVGKTVDRRADIWSFGVVLFEMLTGRRLFAGETVSHVLAHVINGPIDLAQLRGETPRRIRALLVRCLDRDPKTRLRDIGEARVLLTKDAWGVDGAAERARPRFANLSWALAGVLTIALTASLWILSRQQAPAAETNQFVIAPPEKASFNRRPATQAISPDGRMLVFVATTNGGNSALWLQRLGSLPAHPLTPTDGLDARPFWSPDSKTVGFFSGGKLRKVDVNGGTAQALADAAFPQGGTWSRGDEIVFAPRRLDALYRVPAGGGAVTAATLLDRGKQEVGHTWPFFLPDGRHFLYYAFGIYGAGARLLIGSLDSKETQELTRITSPAIYASPGYLLFTRDTMLVAQSFDAAHRSTSGDPVILAEGVGAASGPRERTVGFSASQTGTLLYRRDAALQTHLVWVDRGGQQVDEAAPPGLYTNPVLSTDGKHVAFDRAGEQTDVWLMDLERRITSRFTRQQSNVPVWSPDARTVVFASSRTGKLDLYQRPANMGGPEEVLLPLGAAPLVFPSDWSADGRYLAYFKTDEKTQLDIWVMPLFGDRKPIVFAHGDYNESQGQFSPDGKWMAYVSDESGVPQIYVQSFPTLTGKWQVSTEGGSEPRWRRDGKELFYVAPNGKLMAVAVNSGATFQAGVPRALFDTTLSFAPLRQNYSVSPDGKRFLLNAPAEVAPATMTLVQNWNAGLKK